MPRTLARCEKIKCWKQGVLVDFRCVIGMLAVLCAGCADTADDNAVPDAKARPNVILIVTDNQGPTLLGAYGNADIKTPRIDNMARKGMMFWSAHASSGVCSPSRATLLTGLMPSQTGVHNALPSQPRVEDWSAISEFQNLPGTLKALSYNTALVGKYHLGRHDAAQLGFDRWVTFPSGHTERFYGVEVIDDGERYVVDQHLTDFWTSIAVDYIESVAGDGQPFFLLLTYNGPYGLPPVVNAEYENRHTPYYLANPPSMPQAPIGESLENWAREGDPNTYSEKHGITPWAAIRSLNNSRVMANLAAETTMIDDGVGEIFDALKRSSADRNTVVIYTSDQGAAIGENGLWGNSSWSWPFAAYDANSRVPLILWDNGNRIPEGSNRDEIINQYDIFPTILELIGVEDLTIANSPGRSFAPSIRDEPGEISESRAAFFEYMTVRSVRTDRYRYVKRLLDGRKELYDLESEDGERIDVSHLLQYGPDMEELDRQLTDFFESYSDPEYDLWRGGAAKGRMLDGNRIEQYRQLFPEWDKVELNIPTPFQYERLELKSTLDKGTDDAR